MLSVSSASAAAARVTRRRQCSASARVCHFTAADRIMSIISLSVSHDAFVELPAALRRRRASQIRNANTDGGGIRVAPSQWFRTLVK